MSNKLLGEFDSHYMIRGADGKSFPVAKKGLPEAVHAKIRSLPTESKPIKMSDGGIVPEDSTSVQSQPITLDLNNPMMANSEAALPSAEAYPPQASPSFLNLATPSVAQNLYGTSQPVDSAPPSAPIQINVPDALKQPATAAPAPSMPDADRIPKSPPKPGDPYSVIPGYSDTMKGIQGQAAAANHYSAAAYLAQNDLINGEQASHDLYKEKMEGLDNNIEKLSNEVLNGKIKPNQVWNNMSTGGKIGAAIAVALAGVGQGLTGSKSNAALDAMNTAIDQDIDAQKANLNTKNNLLNHYMQQYHNYEAAENATRLHLATVAGASLQKAAADQGGAQAAAQASMLTGQWKAQYAPMLQKQGLYELKKQMSGGNGTEGGLPLDQERQIMPLLQSDDKEYSNKRVVVNNRSYQHTGAPADAQELRSFTAISEPIRQNVQDLDALGPEAAIPGSESNQKAEAIRAALATQIASLRSSAIGSKRVSDVESQKAEEQVSDPTKFKNLINGGVRNAQFFRDLSTTSDALYRQNLIGYRGRPQTFGPK